MKTVSDSSNLDSGLFVLWILANSTWTGSKQP